MLAGRRWWRLAHGVEIVRGERRQGSARRRRTDTNSVRSYVQGMREKGMWRAEECPRVCV